MRFFGTNTIDLITFPKNEIEKGRVQMLEKQIVGLKKELKFGQSPEQLPVYSLQEFQEIVIREKKKWVILDGMVYDVQNFNHPGGCKYLEFGLGRDMTKSFNGGVYNHSNAARNLLSSMRVASIQGSQVHFRGDKVQRANEYDASFEQFSKSFMSGTALGLPKFIPGAISSNSSAGG